MSDFTTNILVPPDLASPIVSTNGSAILTIRQWNVMWFRVSQWQVDYISDFTASDPLDPMYAHSAVGNFSATGLDGRPSPPGDELGLIAPGFTGFSAGTGTYLFEDASTSTNGSAAAWGSEYELDGLDFGLLSYLHVVTSGFPSTGTDFVYDTLSWTGDAYNTIEGTASGSVSFPNINGSGKTVVGSYDITITPYRFWSWDGKFNTVTGAPI